MPLDSNPEKVTKLSSARSVRRDGAVEDRPITESKMLELFSQFIGPLSSEIRALRDESALLKNSIGMMQKQFEAVKNGEAADAALHVTADKKAAVDIASMRAEIYKEDWYIYTTGHLAEKLEISPHQTVSLIKQCCLKGNSKYHTEIATGRSDKSKVQKYSEDALSQLRRELNK